MADMTQAETGITYAQIAVKYGLKLQTLRVYAAKDETFPAPINDNRRERQFDTEAVDQWFAKRSQRTGPGRPSTGATPRVAVSEAENKKLRNLMKAHGIGVKALAAITGLTPSAAGTRLNGRSRWTVTELTAIEKHAASEGLKAIQTWAARHAAKFQ